MKTKPIRRYILAGLAVWIPILATVVVLGFIIELLDRTISYLPAAYQPEKLLGFHVPGLGVIFSLILVIVTGIIASNILGQRLVLIGESLLSKIPLVRSIYHATKQVINTILSSDSQAFRKVLLVEYPRKGLWSIAFQTGAGISEASTHTETDMITIFVPTTPNPTSGFLIMVPVEDVKELDMSVDEALKFVISLGVMKPESLTEIQLNQSS